MSSRQVPSDRQVGDPLAGAFRWKAHTRPRTQSVAAFGLDAGGHLVNAILREVFGVEGVWLREANALLSESPSADAVVVGDIGERVPAWEQFSRWLGNRCAVVDVRAMAAMARTGGLALRTDRELGSESGALSVMRSYMEAPVYPCAPRVRIEARATAGAGLAAGDEVHLYGRDGDALVLRGLVRDDALERFISDHQAILWGRTTGRGLGALLTVPTRAGGEVTVMDLAAVDRAPEPSAVETLASQLLLGALGASAVTFGRFLVAYRGYEHYVQRVRELAADYARFASVEEVGRSLSGRDIWLMKVALDPGAPPVLLTCGIHPLEWSTHYGVLRYVRFLLQECREDTPYARSLLGGRQLWWVLCACPDGWESRDQQFNVNRNFPGGWRRAIERETYWDAYNRCFRPARGEPVAAFGPHPGSQPETQALMGLLERRPRVSMVADFHETTAFDSFLHQYELPDGAIPELAHALELVEGFGHAFNGRFYAHGPVMAYGACLKDFSTFSFRAARVEERLVPNDVSEWVGYAVRSGRRAVVVECAGADCTHYQTIRRTECAAQAAEQALACETGRLVRNPWGQDAQVELSPHRRPGRAVCRLHGEDGRQVDEYREDSPRTLKAVVPAGGFLRVEYAGD